MNRHLHVTRRELLEDGALAGLALVAASGVARAQTSPAVRRTRSYNPDMEYRPLGKTGAWVSAVCLGGHWKRLDKHIGTAPIDPYTLPGSEVRDAFQRNRDTVVGRCIERGINLVDACSGGEIMAYARALKSRRDSMFISYSWYEKEMRFPEWRSAKALLRGLDEGLRDSGLDYADLWRITCLEKGGQHTAAEVEEMVKALDAARKAGKCRYTGVSSHDRVWLKGLIDAHPGAIQVILSPYTADSTELPTDSLFTAVRRHRTGFLGIKPFASNSLFKGDGSPTSPDAEEDNRRARLALRYILGNPAITAPIPGLASAQQVDNAALAVQERRKLRSGEKADLREASDEMWASLPPDYEWLRDWRNV